ncbi:hypothetical protein DPMN_026337 [Dreissena polymorpha]|uniref:Uncharacterized protein n=1 Tax=Dreissena polymorpha TaxID=45954 RepID=A0A9D4LT80_DREPO|nr:hypothetical protein DPMN_026337 [Dreissena polymorpha]
MRGQGYDGASRSRRGSRLASEPSSRDMYTHCKAHCLYLAIIHASDSMQAKNMMATVQTISLAFDYSAKRLLRFQENL